MRLYVDLDETLIANVLDRAGNTIQIIPRPGVGWFLRMLSHHGDVWLLTAGNRAHVREAFRKLGPDAKYFKGVLTREDMAPIVEQLEVLETPGLSDEIRIELWDSIVPIALPGVMFDDFEVGSEIWAMKSKSIGTSEDEAKWIQVEAYYPGSADRQGLKRAYSEFAARFGREELGRRKKVLAWR